MTFLNKKFSKFLKIKGGIKQFQKKETKNLTFKGKNPIDRFSCHKCGKTKVEGKKNIPRDFKSKTTYIVWVIREEDSTSSTSEEEESAKLCRTVNTHGGVNSYETSSCSSFENSPSYENSSSSFENSPSQEAFVELHEELKKLARVNVDRKIRVLLHDNKIQDMQKE
ncbi:hypothetical protein Lal_00014528 [Lupinus albus]|nr:hypothetical protein Lal_00014528 [Lupinus albus]